MNKRLWLITLIWLPLMTAAQVTPFRFTVLMHALPDRPDESALRSLLEAAQEAQTDFLVVNGIKSKYESCSDKLYRQRKSALESSGVPVLLSMAGSDWIECRDRRGKSSASVRLSMLREQFYSDISWSGSKQIPLVRQSSNTAYRSYGENTRWSYQGILFATLDLPADNNRYLAAAGRNNEFEDRQVANRDWLRRIFAVAKRDQLPALVLICDGNLLSDTLRKNNVRDGFAEVRKQLKSLASKFDGRVLVIQGPLSPASGVAGEINWQGKLGYLNLPKGSGTIVVDGALPALFETARAETQ
jgi:hypothetical protein